MKKGDLRKLEIVKTAETMFYLNGYEKTTVQDIIDALGFSKGGFYHHFESKEALLFAICEEKIDEISTRARIASKTEPDPLGKLNALLDTNSFFKEQHIQFVCLLIKLAYRDDNIIMREKIKRKMEQNILPLINATIKEGVTSGVFYTPYPADIGKIILSLTSTLNDEIAGIIQKTDADQNGLTRVLSRLEFYRHIIERLIEAPYASIIIYEMSTLANVCEAIIDRHRHESWDVFEKTQQKILSITRAD